jgi:hypothetical protein
MLSLFGFDVRPERKPRHRFSNKPKPEKKPGLKDIAFGAYDMYNNFTPLGFVMNTAMALARGPNGQPREEEEELDEEELAAEAAYFEEQRQKREAYQQGKRDWEASRVQRERDARAAKAQAAYDPARAEAEILNRQKAAADNQKAYQQKLAASNMTQMASVQTKNAAVAAQVAQNKEAEAKADTADYISSANKISTEKQNAESEQLRLQKERTANLSLALKTRLGVLDQQKADQKAIQTQNIQMLSNQVKEQSYQQSELQKRQEAQALARQGIKTVGSGKLRRQRKKSSMIY